jgi:hypothetical protein
MKKERAAARHGKDQEHDGSEEQWKLEGFHGQVNESPLK